MELAIDKKLEQQRKWVSYGTTAIWHVLLLLLLWFSMLKENDPPMDGGGGMELSMALGEADMGGPSEIPVTDPAPVEPIPEPVVDEQQTVTQDIEETPVTVAKVETPKKVETKKPTETKVTTPPVEKPRVADQRAMFKKSTTATAQGGSGDGNVPGNEGRADGVEGGSPDGNGIGNGQGGSGGGTGGGNGTGTGTGFGDGRGSYDLRGRTLARRPEIVDNSRETGTVVVGITVDRTGKVTKVQPGIKGTTNLSPALIEKAKQGALDARFSPKPDGPEEQFGTMTFIFRFKQ